MGRCALLRPGRRQALSHAVASHDSGKLISRGLGRSYGDSAVNDGGTVVLHTRMDHLLDFDPQTGVLEAEAGVSIADLIAVFLPRGWFPAVVPGTRFVTLGGAVAANVHGKNHHRDGAFASCVESFDLITGAGASLTCSRTSHAPVFWATLGGMGLTGAITRVRLRLMPITSAHLRVAYTRARQLDDLVDRLEAAGDQTRYSVAWIDCLSRGSSMGRGVVMDGDFVEGAAASPLAVVRRAQRRVPFDLPSLALSRPTVRLFNARYFRNHPTAERLVDYERFFFPLDAVADWNRIYGKRGFVQFQAVFPAADGRDGVRALLSRIAQSGQASFLAVLKRMGPADAGPLSFPMPGLTLALDLPNRGQRLLNLTAELDRIVIEHGGRVYLAKDACLSRASFEAMYPQHEAFKALCRELDPAGRFSSSQSRRLGLTP